MRSGSDGRLERLSRYLFSAPSWPRSCVLTIALGLIIDLVFSQIPGEPRFTGTLLFTLPALFSFLVTRPIVAASGGQMTWNRSGLLAASCAIFAIIISLSSIPFSRDLLPLTFAIALGFISGMRLLVLVAIADYRSSRMVIPAASQSLAGLFVGVMVFPSRFLVLGCVVLPLFFAVFLILLWLIDRPLRRAFGIRGLSFLNAFLAHLTDGSRDLDKFFQSMGEAVYVPQVSFAFRRSGTPYAVLTIPNVHPGPVGDIGGGNLPACFQKDLPGLVMTAHGCATHDFNLVSESEIAKLTGPVAASLTGARYSGLASRSFRVRSGSVQILGQRLGDGLLLVSTRSPEGTEDLDVNIGLRIMSEAHRVTPDLGFVDAHNCVTAENPGVTPVTRLASEYFQAALQAIDRFRSGDSSPIEIGAVAVPVPFTREEGFGDTGIRALVIGAGGQRTAYVLIDGNNIAGGVREYLRDRLLSLVDEAEIMTTDSHVVNTVSGKNPVGLRVRKEEIAPLVEEAVRRALADSSPAEVASATACCEGVVVFGSHRIAQLASTVNTMLLFIAPLSIVMILLAILLSIAAFLVIG